MSSRRLTSITRQSGAPSDDLVQTNPMPAASRMERALTSADAVVTGPSCGFRRALPKKQEAVADPPMAAMAAAPTRARAAYIARSCRLGPPLLALSHAAVRQRYFSGAELSADCYGAVACSA